MAGPLFARPMCLDPPDGDVLESSVSVLDQIASGLRPLAAVQHPLGFLCLPIVREPGWGVCIHVWTGRFPSARLAASGKHAHSWHLESFVLYGELSNAVFALEADEESGPYQLVDIVTGPESDLITPTGRRVMCTEVSRSVVSSGQTYQLGTGVFHETYLGAESEVATLVLSRTRDTPDRMLGPVDLRAHTVTRRHCTDEETRAVAGMARDRLAGGVVVRDQGA